MDEVSRMVVSKVTVTARRNDGKTVARMTWGRDWLTLLSSRPSEPKRRGSMLQRNDVQVHEWVRLRPDQLGLLHVYLSTCPCEPGLSRECGCAVRSC